MRADYRTVGLSTEGHPMEGIVEREGQVVNVQTERVFPVDPRAGADEVTSRDFR